MFVENNPHANVPQTPFRKCTEHAPTGSSMWQTLSKNSTPNVNIKPATIPIEIEPIIIQSDYKSTIEYKSLEFLLKDFISKLDENLKPEFAVLGIPGPVEDNQLLTLPNIPHWNLENGD